MQQRRSQIRSQLGGLACLEQQFWPGTQLQPAWIAAVHFFTPQPMQQPNSSLSWRLITLGKAPHTLLLTPGGSDHSPSITPLLLLLPPSLPCSSHTGRGILAMDESNATCGKRLGE